MDQRAARVAAARPRRSSRAFEGPHEGSPLVSEGVEDAGMPAGGIIPARTFRTTFSQTLDAAADVGEVGAVERQAAGLQAVVVAGDAVAIEE